MSTWFHSSANYGTINNGLLPLILLNLPLALLTIQVLYLWAFVPCIPSGSLLTFDVGRVDDSFTWGQEERIPWRRRLLILSVLYTLDVRLSHRTCSVATPWTMLSTQQQGGRNCTYKVIRVFQLSELFTPCLDMKGLLYLAFASF